MNPELSLIEKNSDIVITANRDITITLPDSPSHDYKIIPVGVNRDSYIRLITAQGKVENKYWSVDVAAFLSREEILMLEEHNAYKQEIDNYISNGE